MMEVDSHLSNLTFDFERVELDSDAGLEVDRSSLVKFCEVLVFQ
jgi:hypothetical protein